MNQGTGYKLALSQSWLPPDPLAVVMRGGAQAAAAGALGMLLGKHAGGLFLPSLFLLSSIDGFLILNHL